jgi:galactose mutarotase-like enzyme
MLRRDVIQGHEALWLENGQVQIAVLPRKGADIYAFIHVPTGVEFLMRTPDGLTPPGTSPPEDFLENYEGAWQELFPNHNDACTYRGRPIPFHGEVALLPWEVSVEADDARATTLKLMVDCRQTPFRLTRRMRLSSEGTTLELEAAVTSLSSEPEYFVWGHHIVLGGGFLMQGCVLEIPAGQITTRTELFEPATAVLAPGQDEPWPMARGRRPGKRIDLRAIPGPEAHTHDDACLTDLAEGRWTVTNPRLGLGFRLEWDAAIFPWVQIWQAYGGADLPPLTGIYGLGLEPWVSRFPLAQAIAHGQARRLAPGETLTTTLRASVLESI